MQARCGIVSSMGLLSAVFPKVNDYGTFGDRRHSCGYPLTYDLDQGIYGTAGEFAP